MNPKESGYYYTYYYNIRPDGYFYKCIYWCQERRKWISWRSPFSSSLHHFEVERFEEETRSDFYSECLDKLNGVKNEI
jgi:hypothetical protein